MNIDEKALDKAIEAIKDEWTYFPPDNDEWRRCIGAGIMAYETAKVTRNDNPGALSIQQYCMPDGRPIFGENSPHDIGEHLAKVAEQPDDCRKAFKKWQPLQGCAGTNGEFDAFLLTQEEAFTAGWNAWAPARQFLQPDDYIAAFEKSDPDSWVEIGSELTGKIGFHKGFQAAMDNKRESLQPVSSSLPERDPTKPAEQQGIFRKFDVRHTDGSSEPGGKHHGCEYFVLDVDHDRHAKAALNAYVLSCQISHPKLAKDMAARYDLKLYDRSLEIESGKP